MKGVWCPGAAGRTGSGEHLPEHAATAGDGGGRCQREACLIPASPLLSWWLRKSQLSPNQRNKANFSLEATWALMRAWSRALYPHFLKIPFELTHLVSQFKCIFPLTHSFFHATFFQIRFSQELLLKTTILQLQQHPAQLIQASRENIAKLMGHPQMEAARHRAGVSLGRSWPQAGEGGILKHPWTQHWGCLPNGGLQITLLFPIPLFSHRVNPFRGWQV